ncbi:hypothetical protein BESB_022810 [Besnoitia besnoiti]|uniref:RRM domain-containing protein n=1 Tax=Besnoitia besnoiti TaxID=94643 RepID=A0A2A9M1D8_BESBE|nr:hypothetical protein BESB_022810 [Besnoitia besnoiti]PFH31789.1 hypothetical protein BESB_022810 [Besnoitia besnoiti]
MAALSNTGIFGSAVAAALGRQSGGESGGSGESSLSQKMNRHSASASNLPPRTSVFDRIEGGIEGLRLVTAASSGPARRVVDSSRRRLVVDTSVDEGDDDWAAGRFGPARRRGHGARSAAERSSAASSPYGRSRPRPRTDGMWRHDLFEEGGGNVPGRRAAGDAAGRSARDNWDHDFFEGDVTSCPGSSAFIRGLPDGIRESDLRDKLSVCGTVVTVKLEGGRLPTARVSFLERSAARKAVQRFHGSRMRGAGAGVVSCVLKVAELDKARQPESAPVNDDADGSSYMDDVSVDPRARPAE